MQRGVDGSQREGTGGEKEGESVVGIRINEKMLIRLK